MQTCSKIEGKDLENTTDIEILEHLQRNHSTTNSQKENDYSHESFHEPKVSALSNSKSSPQPRKRVADLVKIFEKPAEKLSNEKRPSLRTDLFQDACAQPSENSTILLGEKKCYKLYRSSSISNESVNKRIGNNSSQVSRSELPPVVPTVLDIAPNPPNDVQVPSVVHKLVTTKYEEAMNHIKQRKINRKQRNVHMDSCEDVSFHIKTENSNLSDLRNDFSSDLDGHRCDGKSMYAKEKVGKIDFYGTSTDSGLNQSCELLKSKPFGSLDCQGSIETTQKFNQRRKINKIRTSSDSGFDKSDDTLDSKRNSFDVLHCSETTESVEDYDQQEFLRVALGEELMNLTLSSTKSSQFDQTEYTGERSNYEISRPYSNRSFVENSISSQSLPIATISKQIIDSNSNHVVTEEGNNDTQHNETEKLMKQINIQKERLNQVSKALLLCRSQPKYVDQDIRVEAEKITLIETCKKERMEEAVKRSLPENKDNSNASIAITIKNLNFSRATFRTNKRNKKYSWFFVCVLETGTTVLVSKLVKPEANEIFFPESFQFEGHPTDLVITIKLFAMPLRNRKMKKKGLEMKMAPEPSPNYFPAHSFFSLWGKTEINPVTISKQERHCFKLTDMPRWSLLSNTFGAEVETVLKIPVMKKGFLTIGVEEYNRLPLWNNRWCVLDGCKLKYWNHPSEEQVTEPLGEMNLLDANCHQLQEVKNDLCPWPKRSFALDMKVEGYRQPVRKYFLVSDNVKEFEEWWSQINLVLEYLKK
ncbi:uncharacterized protein [Leptinotarsa decemlineata]|uniref:uncharacterized protein n=1 Tax=Leptinotarsa decemlineata TaxID=7539 RepID=UPI003D3058A4